MVEIRDWDSVARLRPEWQALQEQCGQATPYQTWEWNEAWWRHFGSRKRLRLLLFYAGRPAALVGIAPLYTSRHLGTPLRRLAWLGTGQSDYLEPLALPGQETSVSEALLSYLDHGLRGWDIADLQQLRPDSALSASAPRPWPHRARESQVALPMEPCPYLPLPPTWEELTQRLGKKMRSNLGYYERLLNKTFSDARYFLADAQTLDAGMNALFALHQSRWNARWLPGVLGSRRIQAFHREVAARFLDQGRLRLHLLHLDGEIRSALYCFTFGGRTLYYLGGFAPEYSKYSLGTLLTAKAIRQAIDEGCTEFDFLRGNESYKYRWLPEVRTNQRLLLLRSHDGFGGLGELPGKAGFALNRVERYIAHRVKEIAEQQGRKDKGEEKAGTNAVAASSPESVIIAHAVVQVRRERKESDK